MWAELFSFLFEKLTNLSCQIWEANLKQEMFSLIWSQRGRKDYGFFILWISDFISDSTLQTCMQQKKKKNEKKQKKPPQVTGELCWRFPAVNNQMPGICQDMCEKRLYSVGY